MAIDRERVARMLRDARDNNGMSELGNRPVSQDELSKLAALYQRPVADFSPDAEQDHDIRAMLSKYGVAIPARLKSPLENVLSLCGKAVALEGLLGRPARMGPPHYDLSIPRNTAEAIMQGEQVASQERQRLGLGPGSPVDSVLDLVASQGSRVAILELPEEVVDIYLRHRSVGSLLITGIEDIGLQRFGLLHGYALGLFDRERSLIVTTPVSSDELIQIRSNAFAASFLLPHSGIEAAIASLDKGRPSRRAFAVFGYATEDLLEAEVRSSPGSQTLSCHDVASIARRFGASYEATVYRLRALDVISKTETEDLLKGEKQRAASAYTALFGTTTEGEPAQATDAQIELKREIAHLAIEAYRRRLTSKADLAALAPKLQLSGLSAAKLLELAEAAR
jgi:Zn-dependent peptidase ImmA (M78 family)